MRPAMALWVAFAVLVGCQRTTVVALAADEGPPNVLVLLADDVGVDNIGAYGDGDAPPTPHIDALAARGVRFSQAHAEPKCSPTRAGLLTGQYAFRFGLGTHLEPGDGVALPSSTTTIPQALPRRYRSAAIGKWHLTASKDARHPLRVGFDHFRGVLFNLAPTRLPDGRTQSWTLWRSVRDGEWGVSETYATTAQVDDALEVIEEMPEPWFVYLAFSAAHHPYHAPPEGLHTRVLGGEPSEAELFKADVEAMDTEIGRLFATISPEVLARTTVLFMGDNGTPGKVKTGAEEGRPAKGSVFQGGVHVPLVVAGPPVRRAHQGAVSDALVSYTDVYATILELTGSKAEAPSDSVSFAPQLRNPAAPAARKWAYAGFFSPNGPGPYAEDVRMVRDVRYKLVVDQGEQSLYDLVADPLEEHDLLPGDPTAAHETTRRELRTILATLTGE